MKVSRADRTIGHAIELAYGGQLNHGDSIAWGMRCAAWVAHRLGCMNAAVIEHHERLIDLLGPLSRPKGGFCWDDVRSRIGRDNKRGCLPAGSDGAVAMVLLREPGVVVNQSERYPLVLVPPDAVDDALARLRRAWAS